jgi:hypothetical protein
MHHSGERNEKGQAVSKQSCSVSTAEEFEGDTSV